MEAQPSYFNVLADKDHGRDPSRFETSVLRERLERREILAQVAAKLSPMAMEASDHVLHLGAITRGPILAAYHIAKPLGEHNARISSKLAKARSFYARMAKRGKRGAAAPHNGQPETKVA